MTPVLAAVVCGGQQWSLDREALVSPVDYVTYLQVIGTSPDSDTLIIISWTSVDHCILIEFHKPIVNYKKFSLISLDILTLKIQQ